MGPVFLLAMSLLVSSMRLARGWVSHSSFHRKSVPASAVSHASSRVTVTLRSYNSFRWSKDEFAPLGASSRGFNATSFDINDQRDLVSLDAILADTPRTSNNGMTYPGQVDMHEAKLGPNQNIPAPALESDEIAGVLGIDPKDIAVVIRNQTLRWDEKPPVLSVTDMFRNSHFVDMFRGSANYIANHRNSLVVFHIPGDWVDHPNPKIFRDLMNDISLTWLLGLKIVIVVGCRYQVEKRLGTDRQKHMGMIVTDPETLRVVKEEAGYVRFEVERQLARALQGSRGSKGLDGNVVSGNFFSAQPFGVLDGVDYQYSGFVRRFEADKIHQCHANKDIILLTTLGVSPTGEVFNVNSEYLAAYAGGALGASKVIYFLEDDVELRHKTHGSKIPHLRVAMLAVFWSPMTSPLKRRDSFMLAKTVPMISRSRIC